MSYLGDNSAQARQDLDRWITRDDDQGEDDEIFEANDGILEYPDDDNIMPSAEQPAEEAAHVMQSEEGRRGQLCIHGQYRSLCPECSDLA